MSANKTRFTIRLPDEAVKQLRDELDSCYTDAARFQYVVQFYLDYKTLGGLPDVTSSEQIPPSNQPPNQETNASPNRPAPDS